MIPQTLKTEVIKLLKSFALTVAAAAVVAGAQWISGHIPALIQLAGTWAVAHASVHYNS